MNDRRIKTSMLGAAALLVAALSASFAAADEMAEVDALKTRFWELWEADRYADAENVAREMIAIGERVQDDAPNLVTYGQLSLAESMRLKGRYAEAAELTADVVKNRRECLGEQDWEYGWAVGQHGFILLSQGRLNEAQQTLTQSVQLMQAVLDEDDEDLAWVRTKLAEAKAQLGQYDDAEREYLRTIVIYEKAYGEDASELVPMLSSLAYLYLDQDKYEQSETQYQRALRIARAKLGEKNSQTIDCLTGLAGLRKVQGRYDESLALANQARAAMEETLGADNHALIYPLQAESAALVALGRLAEAEQAARRAVTLAEQALSPTHPDLTHPLCQLAAVFIDQSRYTEAEAILRRVRSIREQALSNASPDTAQAMSDLAVVFANQGRYADAEELLRQAEQVFSKTFGPAGYQTIDQAYILAQILGIEGRYEESERMFEQAIEGYGSLLGSEHLVLGEANAKLAYMNLQQGRLELAQQRAQLATEVLTKNLGDAHPTVAAAQATLAAVLAKRGEYDAAAPLFASSRAVIEQTYGRDSAHVADYLVGEAEALLDIERYADAEPLLDRAILLADRGGLAPGARSNAYALRAGVAWKADRRSEALADLRQAMNLAEEQRGQSTGTERERAKSYAELTDVFEQMVEWQAELGDVVEALSAIERARARSLMDELSRRNVDLEAGRSAAEREQLRGREAELKTAIKSLETRLGAADVDGSERSDLERRLAEAREALYAAYRDARSSSPVYRNLLSVGSGPPRMSQLQRRLVGDDGLLLVYFVGKRGSYVVSIGPQKAELARLELGAEAAATLGAKAGPLTADSLQKMFMNESGSGVLEQLSDPRRATKVSEQLHALFLTLLPETARGAIAEGTVKRLLIVPDGPLALLPFETLVVRSGAAPVYLLDVGPPALYCASASVLFNLHERVGKAPPEDEAQLLTVGDPAYPRPATNQLAARDSAGETGSRYSRRGGTLRRLPHSGLESRWVADVFKEQGIPAVQLIAEQATEANVRKQAAGRRWLHLACHGLVDEAYENFFGALALTPSQGEGLDSNDDGFLELAEICELDLSGCELAILSACETNYGPQQRGEGVWGLSRGFLVAGARRVVASNWLVDDEAAASLVSYFTGGLAQSAVGAKPDDYAASLHAAKRWVRNQPKWRSPYYWGTFVLVGPE